MVHSPSLGEPDPAGTGGGEPHAPLAADVRRMEATAFFLGQRLDVRALERRSPLSHAPVTVRAGERGLALVFRFGAAVLVDLDPAEQAACLADLAPRVGVPFAAPEREAVEIRIDPDGDERVDGEGAIRLREASLERLQVVAAILAKSTVLAHYEERVARVFDDVEQLARNLARGGRRATRRGRLLEEIGEVLLIQTQTVGRVEVTEKPEITWDRPDLDRLYERLAVEYELRDRDRALTRKLEIISRTAETYHELLQHRQTLRVEWYIVLLILVEIVLIVYDIGWMR